VRWKEGRRSSNVEDRRRVGGRGVATGGGLGMIVFALIAIFLFKQDPQRVLQQIEAQQPTTSIDTPLTPEQQELGDFVTVVLGYTEDVWDRLFPEVSAVYSGPATYERPNLVLFTGQVQSACGGASAAMGPFYCPGDRKVYIDLSFYDELKRRFQAPGDFAQAYVIAHEVGHHVQNLLGISDRVHAMRQRVSENEYNQLSVRLELQADYLAGVWAHHAESTFQILEHGDVEEGLDAASAIGDDNIQKQSQGYVVPESFTHGSAEQRVRWFRLGLQSGDPLAHNPFDAADL
jgi:predicted metalloprotease